MNENLNVTEQVLEEGAQEVTTGTTVGQKVAKAALGTLAVYGAVKLVQKGISWIKGKKTKKAEAKTKEPIDVESEVVEEE